VNAIIPVDPDNPSGDKQNIDSDRKGGRELDVAHRVAEKREKDVVDIKKIHQRVKNKLPQVLLVQKKPPSKPYWRWF
jgi:hypothetical protein